MRYLRGGFTTIRAVDIKPFDEWYQRFDGVENRVATCAHSKRAERAVDGIAHVYNLAGDMGGMGFIETNKRHLHALGADQHAPADGGASEPASSGYFFSSSACVYNADKQQ